MRFSGYLVGLGLLLAACDKPAAPAPATEVKPMAVAAATSAGPAASAAMAAAMGTKLSFKSGRSTFLIDAPLEKIKGETKDVDGDVTVDPTDLSKATGVVRFKVATLETNTFAGKDKNDAQTEHARAWMEVGPDSPAATRPDFDFATFTIKSVEATPNALADAPEKDGVRTVALKANGVFRLHGIDSPKTLMLTAAFSGPPDAITAVTLKTTAPFGVSLKQHGVMPRDKVGSFLNGALEKVGKKIDDNVNVSLEATATK